MSQNIVEMKGIVKTFSHVQALKGVDFSVRRGEVHALLGENGAGKYTLIKVLTGVYPKDGGEIIFDGQPVEINSREDATKLGVAVIFQEFSLIPTLTVTQNILLNKEKTRFGVLQKKAMRQEISELIQRFDFPLKPDDVIETLSVAQKQMVEILKALSTDARLIIMDEPTASLSAKESEMLYKIIDQLRERGVSIIYISHRLEEVFALSDRITILRDGRLEGVVEHEDIEPGKVVHMMIGKELSDATASRPLCVSDRETVLEVRDLCSVGRFQHVSFQVKAGEVLVLTGLVGAGRTETARAIFGMDPKESGEIYMDGQRVEIHQPLDAIKAGIGFVTEDRKGEGLVLTMSVAQNITLATLDKFGASAHMNLGKEKETVNEYIQSLKIKTPSPLQLARNLSGGNQQKVVLAKWLLSDSKVIIFDEPTRGIDVGAKIEVYNIINSLIQQGVAVVMISSEMPEVLGMSDRVAVMHQGEITGVFDNDGTLTQEKVLYYATGGDKHTA